MREADWEGRQEKRTLALVCEMAWACLGGQSCTWSSLTSREATHCRIRGGPQSQSTGASAAAKERGGPMEPPFSEAKNTVR